MGASVIAYWPGITEEQLESQPGFDNDCKAWGNWMAEREEVPGVYDAIRGLKAEAILTLKTDGWDDEDVSWVSPRQLRDAATRLREAVRAGSPETRVILETYERNANRAYPVSEEFIRDLARLRGFVGVKARKWLKNQPMALKGLHYRAVAEVAWAALILGGDCAGSSSLSLSSSNSSSGSGSV